MDGLIIDHLLGDGALRDGTLSFGASMSSLLAAHYRHERQRQRLREGGGGGERRGREGER